MFETRSPIQSLTFAVVLLAALALGCAAPAEQPAEPVETAAAADTFRLPVSHNDVMVALINDAADPIWLAAWRNPQDDADWRRLERLGTQLQVGGALLEFPGTGMADETWTSQPEWIDWSRQMRDAGAAARAAAGSRDVEAISAAGDRIVEVCEGCHFKFKPALPTEGKFGEISPNEADFDSESGEG